MNIFDKIFVLAIYFCTFCQGEEVFSTAAFRKRYLIEEGSSALLSCPSPRPWLLCVWLSPLSHKQCAVQVEGRTESVCQESRGEVSAGQGTCEMRIQATPSDHGPWTCMLTFNTDYETVRTYLDLQVAVRPVVSISWDSAGLTHTVTADRHSVSTIAGQDKNFTCSAVGGFPRSVISWTLEPSSSLSFSNHADQPQLHLSFSSYTMNSTHSVTIHPTMALHNTTLTCHVTQYTSLGTVLHTDSVSIILQVYILFLPDAPHPEHLGTALPLLLFILAGIVAIIGFWICFLIFSKRRKHKKIEHEDNDADMRKVDTEVVCDASNGKNNNKNVEKRVIVRQVSLIGRRYKDTCRELQEWKRNNNEKLENEERYGQDDFELIKDETTNKDDFHQIDILNNNDIINNNIKQSYLEQASYLPCEDCVPITCKETVQLEINSESINIKSETNEEKSDELESIESHLPTEDETDMSQAYPIACDNLTLFYCNEGCFNQESDCRHQRVELPSFVTRWMEQ